MRVTGCVSSRLVRRLWPVPLSERWDDVLPVGLDLFLLVAVHQVEVELVDARDLQLAQLGHMLVGRAEDAEPIGYLIADERGIRRADLGMVAVVVAGPGP